MAKGTQVETATVTTQHRGYNIVEIHAFNQAYCLIEGFSNGFNSISEATIWLDDYLDRQDYGTDMLPV